MRPILFRGKSLKTGEWVEGNYHYEPNFQQIPYSNYGEDDVTPTPPREKHCIVWRDGTLQMHDIDPETLGQFTGLYDCTKWEELNEAEQKAFLNGKLEEDRQPTKDDWKGRKIFEGDVLNIPHFGDIKKALMCFTEYNLAFSLRNEKGYDRDIFYYAKHNRFPTINLKIIGNIADNPDLVQKGDNTKTKI